MRMGYTLSDDLMFDWFGHILRIPVKEGDRHDVDLYVNTLELDGETRRVLTINQCVPQTFMFTIQDHVWDHDPNVLCSPTYEVFYPDDLGYMMYQCLTKGPIFYLKIKNEKWEVASTAIFRGESIIGIDKGFVDRSGRWKNSEYEYLGREYAEPR